MVQIAIALTVMFLYIMLHLLGVAAVICAQVFLLKFCVNLLGPVFGTILFILELYGIYTALVFFFI